MRATTLSLFACAVSLSIGEECDLYLIDIQDIGLSVFAGKEYTPHYSIEESYVIPVTHIEYRGNPLADYVESFNDTHAIISVGHSHMFNHKSGIEMIDKVPSNEIEDEEEEIDRPTDDSVCQGITMHEDDDACSLLSTSSGRTTTPKDVNHIPAPYAVLLPLHPISEGDQLLIDYGQEWFESRSGAIMTNVPQESMHVHEPRRHPRRLPGCVSKFTTVEGGGTYLTARINISKGTLIEVTRALLVEERPQLSLFGALRQSLWWSDSVLSRTNESTHVIDDDIILEDSNTFRGDRHHAVLLLGRGTHYLPLSSNGTYNVHYDWYFNEWDVDHACSSRMLVSFTAARDISQGEQLIVDLEIKKGLRSTNAPFSKKCL